MIPVQNSKLGKSNTRNMSNQSHQQHTSTQFGGGGYQSKGGQKLVNKSLSMNQTQNMQPMSAVMKQ